MAAGWRDGGGMKLELLGAEGLNAPISLSPSRSSLMALKGFSRSVHVALSHYSGGEKRGGGGGAPGGGRGVGRHDHDPSRKSSRGGWGGVSGRLNAIWAASAVIARDVPSVGETIERIRTTGGRFVESRW